MNKAEFYRCFSPNLHRFLLSCGKKALYEATHANGKKFWVYRLSEIEDTLIIWTSNNPNIK